MNLFGNERDLSDSSKILKAEWSKLLNNAKMKINQSQHQKSQKEKKFNTSNISDRTKKVNQKRDTEVQQINNISSKGIQQKIKRKSLNSLSRNSSITKSRGRLNKSKSKSKNKLAKSNHLSPLGKRQQLFPPGILHLLSFYQITPLFKPEEFSQVKILGGTLSSEEECAVNEVIIEKLSEKIIKEKENRLEAKLQMERLKKENSRWIGVLERMIEGKR